MSSGGGCVGWRLSSDGICEWRQVAVLLAVGNDKESGALPGLLEAVLSFTSKWW